MSATRRLLPENAALRWNLERSYLPLAVSGSLFLLFLLFVLLPSSEWLFMLPYLSVIFLVATLLHRVGVLPIDPKFPAALFALLLIAKLVGSLVRYWTVVDLYGGAADATAYYEQGEYIAGYFQSFDFSVLESYRFRGAGTTWMVHLTGLVYTLFPVSMPGSFFFFAALAFAGGTFFYMAHRVLFPDSSRFWYLILIFLSPSMLFWPSSLGKDSWVVFCTGIVAWGWVQYVKRNSLPGLMIVVLGVGLVAPIRPHIAAFLALALGAAFLIRMGGGRQSPLVVAIGGVLIVVLATVMLQFGAQFLGMEDLSIQSVQAEYTDLQARDIGGGSAFTPPNVLNPLGAISGFITILFRPFPFEANNLQMLITSFESLGWLVLLWLRRRTLLERLRSIPQSPFLAFALAYTVIMGLSLTVSGNFGIVARQRVMFLPLFWMLFA